MKVKDLIHILSKYDPEIPLLLWDSEWGYHHVEDILYYLKGDNDYTIDDSPFLKDIQKAIVIS